MKGRQRHSGEVNDFTEHSGLSLTLSCTLRQAVNLSRQVFGSYVRLDKVPPPDVSNGPWVWDVDNVMKDGALAIGPACRAVFGTEINEGTCSVHGSLLWFQSKRPLFADWDTNRELMGHDFEELKDIQFEAAASIMRQKMLEKWRGYGEGRVVAAFEVAWSDHHFTRAEVNKDASIPGGMPPHNNGPEAHNSSDKRWAMWQRRRLRQYLPYLVQRAEVVSRKDQTFGRDMHHSVNSNAFYERVSDIAKAAVSPLTVHFSTNKPGEFIIAASKTIEAVRRVRPKLKEPSEFIAEFTTATSTREGTIRFPRSRTVSSQLRSFIAIAEDCSNLANMTFDVAIGWLNSFYYFRPIADRRYIEDLHGRLALTGMKIEPVDAIVARVLEGFMFCGCHDFLEYAWCAHSCADAVKKGIITGYPKNKDPEALQMHKRGRPRQSGQNTNKRRRNR